MTNHALLHYNAQKTISIGKNITAHYTMHIYKNIKIPARTYKQLFTFAGNGALGEFSNVI